QGGQVSGPGLERPRGAVGGGLRVARGDRRLVAHRAPGVWAVGDTDEPSRIPGPADRGKEFSRGAPGPPPPCPGAAGRYPPPPGPPRALRGKLMAVPTAPTIGPGRAALAGLAVTLAQVALATLLAGEGRFADAYRRLANWDGGWYVNICEVGYRRPAVATP